jgi:hypothetical protein
MSKKVAVGGLGDDWGPWLAVLGLLASVGIVPKDWRPLIGTLGGAVTVYKILKRLGWL